MPEPTFTRRQRHAWRLWQVPDPWIFLASLLAVVGLGLRVWILGEPLGAVDSDEAVVGLMARHILQGEFSAFVWGQPYGGSAEALMTAPLFAVAGASTAALKAVPLALHVVAVWITYQMGTELGDRRVALIGSAVFWAAPAVFIYRSTQAYSFYASGLVLGLVAVLLILKLRKRCEDRKIWWLGLVLGAAWWTNPQMVPLVVPALLWLLIRSRDVRLRVWMLTPGFIIGALPWIVNNLEHDWHSVRTAGVGSLDSSYFDRLGGFFQGSIPMILGLRLPISAEPVVQESLATVLAMALIATCIWIGSRLGAAGETLAVIIAVYPFIYAASPYSWYFEDARYVYFLWPLIALLLAAALIRLSPRITVIAAVAIVSVTSVQVVITNRQETAKVGTSNAHPPIDLAGAGHALREVGIDRLFTDYWIAYKLTFETEGRVVAASMGQVRYEPYQEEVRAAERPAYAFVEGTEAVTQLRQALVSRGIGFDEYAAHGLVIIVPAVKVLPEEIPEVTTT